MRVSVGFCTSQWWVSRVIRFFTRAPVSHAYLVFDDIPALGSEVYEAAWCGFRVSTRDLLTTGGTYIVKEIQLDVDAYRVMGVCRRWLETPYSYMGLVGQAWVQIGRWCGQRWRNPTGSIHHQFCSEAVVNILAAASYVPLMGLDSTAIDPYTLELLLTPKEPS